MTGHVDGAPNIRFVMTAESENVTSWVVGYECTTNGDDTTNAKLDGADDIVSMNWILKVGSDALTESNIPDLIMTINEPIDETLIEITDYRWRCLGNILTDEETLNILQNHANDIEQAKTDKAGKLYPTLKARIDSLQERAEEGKTFKIAESLDWVKEQGDTTNTYVLPDGSMYIYAYGTSMEAIYTNVLDNTEKQLNKRWSHSKKDVQSQAGHMTTGLIPVKVGDVIRVNLPLTKENFIHDYNRVHYFTSAGNYVAGHKDGAPDPLFVLTAESENVTSWVVGYECTTNLNDTTNAKLSGADDIVSMNWIYRASANEITEADISGLIMTINEPICETEVTDYRWRYAGNIFTGIDCVDKLAEHENRINELAQAIETGSLDKTEKEAYSRIKNWKYPINEDAPVFLLENDKPAIDPNEKSAEAIYAKYDALMSANPDFITKVDCGKASDGTTSICVYHFKESEPHFASANWSETKPVLLICSGVHPTEQTGVHSLYHAMEEITTNPKLRDLRRNVHFIVMPMINPTGFTDSEYGVRNPDGIQVHYNFEVEFKYPTDAGYVANGNRNHGGETPLSIPETQYFDALMNEYKDTLACVISCHNNDVDVNRGTGYIWCSCGTHYMCNLGFRFIDKMSMAWKEKYGEAFDEGVRWANNYALTKAAEGGSSLFKPEYVYEQPEWDYRVGMASISGSGGTEYKQAMKYGVHGINVETCDRCLILDKDFSKKRTANVLTMGTETYINFFRTFMAAYDPKNKKDYAPNLPWES